MAVAVRVDTGQCAAFVPESTAIVRCTVTSPDVVVAVISGEHPPAVPLHCISSVTRVPGYLHRIVGRLTINSERAVLGIAPAAVIERLQVKSQLIAVIVGQLMQQFVAEPVVAFRVAETSLELLPRTVEEVGSVDILLDQQRNTVGYTTKIIVSKKLHQLLIKPFTFTKEH